MNVKYIAIPLVIVMVWTEEVGFIPPPKFDWTQKDGCAKDDTKTPIAPASVSKTVFTIKPMILK